MVLWVLTAIVEVVAGRMVHTCLIGLRSVYLVKEVELGLIREGVVLHAGLLVLALDHVIIFNVSIDHGSVQVLLHAMKAFVFAHWSIASGRVVLGRCVLRAMLWREAFYFKSRVEGTAVF